tara:strand:- start:109 stop:282 length:174 start_codon:yes stop_codon:yes gene_type:complete
MKFIYRYAGLRTMKEIKKAERLKKEFICKAYPELSTTGWKIIQSSPNALVFEKKVKH